MHKIMMPVIGTVLLCAGCAAAPDRQPEDRIEITEHYSRQPDTKTGKTTKDDVLSQVARSDQPWWHHYNDKELNTLIETALRENPGILQTRSQLEQAAAAARISFADLLPDASIGGTRSTNTGTNETPSSFSLRGAAGYEIDLWGGNRAAYKSSRMNAHAVAQDVQIAHITLSASIVETWLRLVSLREEESLLHKQMETNEMVLDLQHKRYANGIGEALDVLQQTEVLERTKSQLPDILSEQETTQQSLALLTGKTPSAPPDITQDRLPALLPLPATGVPADLLRERPDIKAAWLRLLSADWATEAARINRLPNINISADISTASSKFTNLFDAWLLDLALNLAMPVLDGGRLAAEQARQKALSDERFHAYRETVLAAIGEVENALTRNHFQEEKITALENQLLVSRNALEQATLSYGNGNTDYISVLNSLIGVQSLEQQLVQARRDLALFRVALYRALGIKAESTPMQASDNKEGANG